MTFRHKQSVKIDMKSEWIILLLSETNKKINSSYKSGKEFRYKTEKKCDFRMTVAKLDIENVLHSDAMGHYKTDDRADIRAVLIDHKGNKTIG